jgi:hypothetical protein
MDLIWKVGQLYVRLINSFLFWKYILFRAYMKSYDIKYRVCGLIQIRKFNIKICRLAFPNIESLWTPPGFWWTLCKFDK